MIYPKLVPRNDYGGCHWLYKATMNLNHLTNKRVRKREGKSRKRLFFNAQTIWPYETKLYTV